VVAHRNPRGGRVGIDRDLDRLCGAAVLGGVGQEVEQPRPTITSRIDLDGRRASPRETPRNPSSALRPAPSGLAQAPRTWVARVARELADRLGACACSAGVPFSICA